MKTFEAFEVFFIVVSKGPFTSSDCDATAMTLQYRSEIKCMCSILYCHIQRL